MERRVELGGTIRALAWGLAVPLAFALALGGCGDGGDGSPSSPSPTPAPSGPTLEPARIRAVVDSYVAAFRTRDRALYLSLFAEDGTVEDPVGATPVVGQKALATFFDAATAAGPVILDLLPDDVRVSGNHVAFAFRLRIEAGGRAFALKVIDTFDFDPDGRIRAMRAYWNPSELRPIDG